MTFKKITFITNAVALLASIALLVGAWVKPAAAAACDPDVYFALTDPVSGKIISEVPQTGKVLFYVKLTPRGECVNATIDSIVVNEIIKGKNGDESTYVASFTVPVNDILRRASAEYKKEWGVSGLLDNTTGQPVQNGGKLAFQAGVKLLGETNFHPSAITPLSVAAAGTTSGGNGNDATNTDGNTAGGSGNEGTSVGTIGTISNPIGYESLGALVVAIIRFLLTMIGGLAVLFIIIGAVRMVTSQGNEKAVTAGKQTVTWAVIGLITALMAFSLISLVQSLIGRK